MATWMIDSNPTRANALQVVNEAGERPAGVFVVNCWSEETLAKKVAPVDRKLAKHGMPAVELISFERKLCRKTETTGTEDGTPRTDVVAVLPFIQALVYIESAVIRIGDRKQIAGVIERVGDSDDMVISPWGTAADDVTAITTLTEAVGREIRCDHCKSNRRRNGAWILKSEDGSLFMVAKSCAKEYFGQNVAGLLNDLIDMDEVNGGHTPSTFDRVENVAIAVGTILRYGFVSNAALANLNPARRDAGLAEIVSTSSMVSDFTLALRSLRRSDNRWEDQDANPKGHEAEVMVEDHLELAASVIDGITRSTPETAFEVNVQALVRSMAYSRDWWKHESQIVAGIAAYLKQTGLELPNVWSFKESQKKAEAVAFVPGYLAAVGTKVSCRGTVEAVKFFDNDFGGKWMVIVRTTTNHKVLYRGTAKVGGGVQGVNHVGDLELGDTVVIEATVSEHETYTSTRGSTTYSTIVQRPKITLVN